MATSLQCPLSCVFKVAVVEWFNCILCLETIIFLLSPSLCQSFVLIFFFYVDNPRGLKENTAMDNIEKANRGKALEISEK